MTLAEVQAYVGAPSTKGATYFATRGELHVIAWEDAMCGRPGWWFAITRHCGAHRIVVALGWSAGQKRDRDIEIAVAIARIVSPEQQSEELAS